MLTSFLTGFSYGVGFGVVICTLLRMAVSVREIPSGV